MNSFSEKILVCAKGPFWAQKWRILKTLDPRLIFLKKFCIMTGANRQMKIVLMIFPKKLLFGANGPFWAPRWCIIITLDQLQDFFKNFAPVADRYTKIILMAVLKKILFGANGPFRTQNCASSQLWICRKNYFTTLHNERGQERHENYINGFSEENHIHGNLVILAQRQYGVLITLYQLASFFY